MRFNWPQSLDLVLAHEGGFVDHPEDPGGATNRGITLNTFKSFYGEEMTKRDLVNITGEQVAHIYKSGYWDKCRCDDLPGGVDYAVFDAGVNSGPSQAAKWLQCAIRVKEDGIIGPITLSAAYRFSPELAIHRMCLYRMQYLQALSSWDHFGKGWSRRVVGVQTKALEMMY